MDKHTTAQEVHFRSRISTLALDGRNLCIIDKRSASKDGFTLDYKSVTIREGAIRQETTAIKDLVIVRISDGGTGGFVTLPTASGNEALPTTSTASAFECTKCRVSDTSGIRVEQQPKSSPVHALQKKPKTSKRTSKYKRAPSWGTGSGGESRTGYFSGVEPSPFSISRARTQHPLRVALSETSCTRHPTLVLARLCGTFL